MGESSDRRSSDAASLTGHVSMPEDDGDEESDDDSDEDGDDDNEEDDSSSSSSSSPSERLSVWQDNIWERMEEIAVNHQKFDREKGNRGTKKFIILSSAYL